MSNTRQPSRTDHPDPLTARRTLDPNPAVARDTTRHGLLQTGARRHPITVFLTLLLAPTLAVYAVVIATGAPFEIAQASELIFLLLAPTLVTRSIGGRPAVRQLYTGLTRWRIGTTRWLVVLAALPAIGITLALSTGTLEHPAGGWTHAGLMYLLLLAAGAITGNLWEETAWAGFVQTRLIDRHALFTGSMLTAIPFVVIHLPLAFQNGLHATTTRDVLITWGFLIALAPFMRYLIGVTLLDTHGSTLAVGILHAAFNATMAMTIFHGSWQALAALILLTIVMAAYRTRRPHSPALPLEPK